MKTKILTCDCKSDFQDLVYGKGKRLHNFCVQPKERQVTGYRCTVCKSKKNEADRNLKLEKGPGSRQASGAAQHPVWPKEIRKSKNKRVCRRCGHLVPMERKGKRFVHPGCRQHARI